MDIKDYILQHAPGNLYWKDLEGRYMGCNLEFLQIAGMAKQEDIIGKKDADLFFSQLGEHGIKMLEEADQDVMKNGVVITREEIGIDVKGEKAVYLTKKMPLKNDVGGIIGVIGSSIDITQQKQAEQVKINFIQNMSHDLRTPLTGLIGMASILEEEVSSQYGKEAAYNLKAAANILLDLLNNIIEFSKIEFGELPIHNEELNIKELIHTLLVLLKPSASQKNVKLSVHYDENILSIFGSDKVRIHRILLNLVGNAIKFTPPNGCVDISVSTIKNLDKNVVLKFSIKDTGEGIPEEKREIIFSKFSKLASSYTNSYKGYGLGLSIVKQFTFDLKGEVDFTSTEGNGSTFNVSIPIKEISIAEKNKSMNGDSDASLKNDITNFLKKFKKQVKILLVEDDKLAQLGASHQLKRFNCIVDVASCGEEAINLVENNDYYELVFMDIGLPDQNGCEVTPKILKIERGRDKVVPVIALSAHLDDSVYNDCLDAGMVDAIPKPLDDSKIIKIFTKYIIEKK